MLTYLPFISKCLESMRRPRWIQDACISAALMIHYYVHGTFVSVPADWFYLSLDVIKSTCTCILFFSRVLETEINKKKLTNSNLSPPLYNIFVCFRVYIYIYILYCISLVLEGFRSVRTFLLQIYLAYTCH